MDMELSRRGFVGAIPGLGLAAGAILGQSPTPALAADPAAPDAGPYPGFPRQDQKVVQELVTVSHFNEARVRELVELKPQLVNAWWDWGFGDWESPLGASSHVGNRGIAEFLLSKGARIDIFAAAMLGMTDVVKAFVAATPDVLRAHGPHGFTLFHHAKAGGEKAKATLEYVQSLGQTSTLIPSETLTDEHAATYVGQYRFGPGPNDVFEVKFDKAQLTLLRPGGTQRRLFLTSEHEFFPAGAPDVKIRFTAKDGKMTAVSVVEREPVLTATRV